MNSSIVARPTVDNADENEIEVSTLSANMDGLQLTLLEDDRRCTGVVPASGRIAYKADCGHTWWHQSISKESERAQIGTRTPPTFCFLRWHCRHDLMGRRREGSAE